MGRHLHLLASGEEDQLYHNLMAEPCVVGIPWRCTQSTAYRQPPPRDVAAPILYAPPTPTPLQWWAAQLRPAGVEGLLGGPSPLGNGQRWAEQLRATAKRTIDGRRSGGGSGRLCARRRLGTLASRWRAGCEEKRMRFPDAIATFYRGGAVQ